MLFVYQGSFGTNVAFPNRGAAPWSAHVVESMYIIQLFVSIAASLAVSRITNSAGLRWFACVCILLAILVTGWNAFFAQMVITNVWL
jgi:hypothetical protein